eukprot:scaffold25970_cov73-Cyclotella_meneghiniana.AAC.2
MRTCNASIFNRHIIQTRTWKIRGAGVSRRSGCGADPIAIRLLSNANCARFKQIVPKPDANSGLPLARSSHGISSMKTNDCKTRLLIYGGENTPRVPIADTHQQIWLAEESDNGWKWISPFIASDSHEPPKARLGHAQASVGKYAYIFGGRGTIGKDKVGELNDMYKVEVIYSPTWPFSPDYTVKYTKIECATPEARSFHKMIAVGSDLFMFGGCGVNGRLNALWKFNTKFQHWTNLGTSVLRGRGGASLFGFEGGNKIAVIGGFAGQETNDSHVFDTETSAWNEEVETLDELSPRSVAAFGTLPNHKTSYLFGGEVDPSILEHEGAGSFEDDLILFSESGKITNHFRRDGSENWPTARGWADSTVCNDKIYLFGGLTGNDSKPERLDDLWECCFEF